ncbi:MAG: DUF4012 domain-containing protein [Actinomycetota bacterium]|nr:DUF4012 domain-containing protein [Actinomycetota bacterium]
MLIVVVLWCGFGVWSSISGVRAALRARDGLDVVLDEHAAEDIARGVADAQLAEVRDDFLAAADDLGGWQLAPIRLLPVLGRQIRSGAALSGAAAEMIDIGLVLTDEIGTLADELDADRVELTAGLRRLESPLSALQVRAEAIDLGPDEALVGVLDSARREARVRHEELLDGLGRAADGAGGFAEFLEGPSRYLLFAANTSQMQSGVGGLLSVGVVEVVDGEISVSSVSSVTDLPLPIEPVALEDDYADRWGWLDPNEAWSNLGTTPRFDITASTAAAMWEAAGSGPVDGVMAVDAVAISSVLKATGPVRVEGEQYGAKTLLTYLTHGQYLDLTDDIYEDWRTFAIAQAERRDHLASIASQVVSSITSDEVDGLDAVIQLADAARGRHLMFWSADEAQQAAWRAAGVSGELEADSMLLSLVNRSATKADFYLTMDAEVSIERFDDRSEVVVVVNVVNDVPFGEPRYVAGPHPELDLGYGDHLAIVALNLPGWAKNGRVDGDENLAIAGGDGPTRVVGSWITVARDSVGTRTFRFELPPEVESITVEPGARHPVTRWRFESERFTDGSRRTITW